MAAGGDVDRAVWFEVDIRGLAVCTSGIVTSLLVFPFSIFSISNLVSTVALSSL